MGKSLVNYKDYRAIADKMNLTDYRVAQISQVPRQTISDWKLGLHTPLTRTTDKIAKALGVTVDFKSFVKDKEYAS